MLRLPPPLQPVLNNPSTNPGLESETESDWKGSPGCRMEKEQTWYQETWIPGPVCGTLKHLTSLIFSFPPVVSSFLKEMVRLKREGRWKCFANFDDLSAVGTVWLHYAPILILIRRLITEPVISQFCIVYQAQLAVLIRQQAFGLCCLENIPLASYRANKQ